MFYTFHMRVEVSYLIIREAEIILVLDQALTRLSMHSQNQEHEHAESNRNVQSQLDAANSLSVQCSAQNLELSAMLKSSRRMTSNLEERTRQLEGSVDRLKGRLRTTARLLEDSRSSSKKLSWRGPLGSASARVWTGAKERKRVKAESRSADSTGSWPVKDEPPFPNSGV